MKFYKSLMMERLEKEGRIDQVNEEIEGIMDNLDGCEASESCWARRVDGKPVLYVVGKDGNGNIVNESDCK